MLGSTTSRLSTTACPPRPAPCSRLQAPAACSSLHAARPLAPPSQAAHASFLRACSQQTRAAACGGRRRAVRVRADRGGGVDLVDRAVASVVYLVPLADGLKYGRYIFLQFPAFAQVIMPLEPLFRLYFTLPLASLITFFGLYYGVVANQSFSRYVRFNCMQALLLDIILIVPSLIESVLGSPSAGGPAIQLYINAYNTVALFTFACVAYGVGSSLLGQVARLPLVANSADAQVR